MKKQEYICNKCNHGDCKLVIEDNEDGELDIPEWCPFDQFQVVIWNVKTGE